LSYKITIFSSRVQKNLLVIFFFPRFLYSEIHVWKNSNFWLLQCHSVKNYFSCPNALVK
jgi:hypothetical protein